MGRKNQNPVVDIEQAVKAELIKLAIDKIEKNRLSVHLANIKAGELAYLLDIPMFIPCINEIIICRSSRNIGIVTYIDITKSICNVIFATKETKWFKTTESANNYKNNQKVDYDDWSWHESHDYPYPMEKLVACNADYSFVEIEPNNYPGDIEEDFKEELEIIHKKMNG